MSNSKKIWLEKRLHLNNFNKCSDEEYDYPHGQVEFKKSRKNVKMLQKDTIEYYFSFSFLYVYVYM